MLKLKMVFYIMAFAILLGFQFCSSEEDQCMMENGDNDETCAAKKSDEPAKKAPEKSLLEKEQQKMCIEFYNIFYDENPKEALRAFMNRMGDALKSNVVKNFDPRTWVIYGGHESILKMCSITDDLPLAPSKQIIEDGIYKIKNEDLDPFMMDSM